MWLIDSPYFACVSEGLFDNKTYKHKQYATVNTVWSAMVERFSALDLCSDNRVIRMWVRILAATMVLVSFSKTYYHNCFSPPSSKWVPVRAELVVVFDSPMCRNGSN